jgi:hypothetical protein
MLKNLKPYLMNDLNNIVGSLKGKKVAFFHSHILWASHFETELELIELIHNQASSVVSFVCNDDLGSCDHSSKFDLFTCSSCIKRRNVGLSLAPKTKVIPVKPKNASFSISPEISVAEFIKLNYKSFDVGYAVLSSMIHKIKDPYLEIRNNFDEFQSLVNSSIGLYEFFLESLIKEKIDIVIIFNGRFAHTRSLLRASEKLSLTYYTHERGSRMSKFMLFKNTMPHDIEYFHGNLMNLWDNTKIEEQHKIKISEEFYTNRKNGSPKEWFSFVKNQEKQLLPDNFNTSKYNICIFLSSEDEFSSIGDKRKRLLFDSQIEGLQYLFKNLKMEGTDMHFYIRMHPNSSKSVGFIEEVKRFENEYVKVIEPLSPVSTYHLLDNVNKAVTFGSTIGIEATFWGKPSINLDNAFYINLDVTYNPKDKSDIINLILDKNLPPKPKENTLPYGYYLSEFGYDFRYYMADTFGSGKYKDFDLNAVKGLPYKKPYKYKYIPYRFSKIIYKYKTEFIYYLQKKYKLFF